MANGAPRRPLRPWRRFARGAIAALCLWGAAPVAIACSPQHPSKGVPGRAAEMVFSNRAGLGRHETWAPRDAELVMHAAYAGLTDEYGHGILGPLRDTKALTIHIYARGSDRITCPAEAVLPAGEVFEDIAPRLADLDGDGMPEVIVVHSTTSQGARLAIYDRRARVIAATPHIGRRNRWLAPIGAADLDGDGMIEIAYIDRPHLAKTLRVWRFQNGRLIDLAQAGGLTNHKIGWDFISGGIRDCGQGPEMITADAGWSRIMASKLQAGRIVSRALGPYDPQAIQKAMRCF